jgi:hypothetical protein
MAYVARHRFYPWLALALSLLVFIGFARSYYLKAWFDTPPLPLFTHVHALLFTGWLGLFFVQARLIAKHRADLHRRVGIAGAVLAVVMIVTALDAGVVSARAGRAAPGFTPIEAMVLPFASALVFAVLVGAALAWRHRAEVHQRLMVLATISIAAPGIGRVVRMVLGHFSAAGIVGVTGMLIAACLLRDWVRTRRVHAVYLAGGLFVLASWPLRMMISRSEAWQQFAGLLVS